MPTNQISKSTKITIPYIMRSQYCKIQTIGSLSRTNINLKKSSEKAHSVKLEEPNASKPNNMSPSNMSKLI